MGLIMGKGVPKPAAPALSLSREEVLRLILEHTPDPIVIMAADGRFVEINEAALEQFAWRREEMLGRRESDLEAAEPGALEASVADAHQVAHSSGPSVRYVKGPSASGSDAKYYKSYRTPARTEAGDALAIFIKQDVTELEQARAALAEREATLSSIVDSVASGTWQFEPQSGRLVNDAAWMSIFGLTPKDHDGTAATFARLLHEEDRDEVWADVLACIEGRSRSYVREHRMVRVDDGRTIWVRDAGRVVDRDAEGKATKMVGAVIDITSLKEQQAELERRRVDAEQAAVAKSRFLANMSHELRTPMTGVLGMLDHLLETELDPDQQESVEIARQSARSLLAILNDILDTSKLEAGGIELESIEVDLDALIVELRGMFERSALEKGIVLRLERDPNLARSITGDPGRLRQVLVNLFGNALKFTAEGRVDLEIKRSSDPTKVLFSVQDTGIGIPEEAQPKLFERFSQADVSTTRRFGGTGLGLAISDQMVELMGGELKVDSEVGKGSRFYFELPYVRWTKELPLSSDELGREVELPPLSILLAEDVVVNQRVVRRLLERFGHRVHVVGDGQAAVQALQRSDFDLVLMDVHMPVMDGLDATRRIRSLEGSRGSMPIVALTANVMEGDRETYLAAGMNACASKPIDRKELFSAMAQALEA